MYSAENEQQKGTYKLSVKEVPFVKNKPTCATDHTLFLWLNLSFDNNILCTNT